MYCVCLCVFANVYGCFMLSDTNPGLSTAVGVIQTGGFRSEILRVHLQLPGEGEPLMYILMMSSPF